MSEKQEKMEAQPTAEAIAGPDRSWLQPLLEAISDRPPLKRLLEAGIALPLLTAGTDSPLTDFNMRLTVIHPDPILGSSPRNCLPGPLTIFCRLRRKSR